MDTKFVYTLSSEGTMPYDVLHSVKSLLRWVDPENIILYYTPPRLEDHARVFKDLNLDLREVPNSTEPFPIMPFSQCGHYGEKVRVCDVHSENAVFLDCDTLVFNDPHALLSGDFEVKVRPSTVQPDSKEWREMFRHYGEERLNWMPNAGVIVFKDATHQKIKNVWRQYLSADLSRFFTGKGRIRLDDQWALALAISDRDIETMSRHEHIIEWDEGIDSDSIVYHFDQKESHGITVQMLHKQPLWVLRRLYQNKIKNQFS